MSSPLSFASRAPASTCPPCNTSLETTAQLQAAQTSATLPGPPKVPKIMAQYPNIKSRGSIGPIILGVWEVQVNSFRFQTPATQHQSHSTMAGLLVKRSAVGNPSTRALSGKSTRPFRTELFWPPISDNTSCKHSNPIWLCCVNWGSCLWVFL